MDKSSDIVEHCLSDKCFEKSRIVKIWLNLIYHQPQDIDSAQASDFEPLFLLIDKYDCSYPLSAAIQYLRACLDAGLPVEGIALRLGFKHYRIRAGLELGLAALIKHGETEMTNRYSTIFTSIPYAERDQVWLKSLHEGVRANHWDLAILRVTELKQLPVEVLLAWMRANAHHNCSHNYIRHVEVAKVMRQIVTGKTPITPSGQFVKLKGIFPLTTSG